MILGLVETFERCLQWEKGEVGANSSAPGPVLPSSPSINLSSSCSDISQLELSLEEAEGKIGRLLKVKEKLVVVEVSSNTFFTMLNCISIIAISGGKVSVGRRCIRTARGDVHAGSGEQDGDRLLRHPLPRWVVLSVLVCVASFILFCHHRHIATNICFSAAGGDSNRVPAYHLLSVGYAGFLTRLFIEIYL